MSFLALFVSLPTKASSGRVRLWRTLKALGCATLRDGVYLLPETAEHAQALAEATGVAREAGGSAEIYRLDTVAEAQQGELRKLFSRDAEYADIVGAAHAIGAELDALEEAAAGRRIEALERRCRVLAAIDFYPGEAQPQAVAALEHLRAAIARHFSPDEPSATATALPRLDAASHRGRTWATRARPWVDRLASAWLIRRFIDPEARIVWLAKPADCEASWLGFDFDGAAFSHVGSRVTFEVLAASFGLDADPAVARIGALVHCLDVGGLAVAEAAGVEAVLRGLRGAIADDDRLLDEAGRVFAGLYENFVRENGHD